MKKFLLFFVAIIFLAACEESKEAKADKIIRKALNGVIVNIDTYEPIETIIDSAYAPMQTAEMFELFAKLPAQMRLYNKLMSDVSLAKSSMAIYEDSYTSFGKEQYKKFKEEYESSQNSLDAMEAKMAALGEKLEKLSKEEKVFNGYLVRHKFRYVTKDGEKTIGGHLFLMNKDITAIEATWDLEDEDIKQMIEAYANQLSIE